MNKKQEEYILYLISYAISMINPNKREEVESHIKYTFNELGEIDIVAEKGKNICFVAIFML